MPVLDLFTLTVVSVGSFLLGALALLSVRLLNRSCHGLRRCVGAYVLFAAGFSVIASNLTAPGKIQLVAVNVLFAGGAISFLDGIRAFREFRRPVRIYASVLAAFWLALLWFVFVNDNANARSAIRAFFIATAALCGVVTMASRVPPRDRAVYWPTAAVLALLAVSLCARGFVAMLGPPARAFQALPIDFFNVIAMNLWMLAGAFGLAMATNLRLQRKTEQLALFDTLTSLPNRRMFEERLEEAERRAFATGRRIALIYCDLDDFKSINDTLGHEGGDKALRLVADRMQAVVGDSGCLARVGGDEFLVLLEDAPARDDIHALIERLRSEVECKVGFSGRTARLKMSCGVAIFPEDVGSATDLIRLADAAMYVMKQHGRMFALHA